METYTLDGAQFSTLEDFAAHFSARVLGGEHDWSGNLDAFNDILRGGFGTPDEFTIRWLNTALSRERLGYPETARQLELRLERCHPSNRESVAAELAAARCAQGPTVFDWLVEIIRDHGPGGSQAEDRVHLDLVP